MNCLKRFTLGLVASSMLLPAAAPAMADGGVQIGVLSCNSVPGTQRDLLIHSSVGVRCVFDRPGGQERYKGETGIGLGFDLNWNRSQTIHFAVLGGTTDARLGSHALAGRYVGGQASATFLVGGGAGALVGAGSKAVSLQPVALEGSTGWGLAGGIGYLSLEADK